MAPVETYWTANNTLLIQPTPGDPLTNPYTILPGSAGVDFTNPQVWIDARLLFPDPAVDPVTGQFPDRPDFDTATLADFMSWHSQHQADYILEKGTSALSPPPPDPVPDPLPTGTLTVQYVSFTNGPTLVLGQDGRTVYNIDALTAANIATMPFLDQKALAGLEVFQAKAANLLVRPALDENGDMEAVDDVRAEMVALVDALILEVQNSTNYDVADRDTFLDEFQYDPVARITYYPHFFVEQLNLYKLRLLDMALFSPIRINEFVAEVKERFDRLKSYSDTPNSTAGVSGALATGVNSLDDSQTMQNGISIFLEMESQLFQIALARAYVTATGTLIEPVQGKLMSTRTMLDAAKTGGSYSDFGTFLRAQATGIYTRITSGSSSQQLLDGPTLIFLLQTFSNYEAEAEAQIRSEELQQQSKLLEDYSKMQKLLNETLNKFEPDPETDDDADSPDAAERLALKDLTTVSQLTDEEKLIAAMFDTVASSDGGDNIYHPIERDKSADGDASNFRPTEEIASGSMLVQHEKTVWDALSVKLGEATKIIGQSSQLDMDAINRLSQQKNRHYELGSNILNKMTELLREITS